MRVLIAGANGMLGSALMTRLWGSGTQAFRLVRKATDAGDIEWDPQRGHLPAHALDGVDAIVNLAGAGIGDHRWTSAYRRELRDSRIRGTALLAERAASMPTSTRPPVMLNASAVGWYGDRGDELLDETSSGGSGFLAELCRDWEAATAPAAAAEMRVVMMRTGVVLSATGGALRKQLPLFKLGLGGRMGNGRQWLSWIAIDDHVSAMVHLLHADIEGPVNLTAPNPVRNTEFTATLAKVLHRPAVMRIPAFAPRLLLGRELADALLFTGQRVQPKVLTNDGFRFAAPTLTEALKGLLP